MTHGLPDQGTEAVVICAVLIGRYCAMLCELFLFCSLCPYTGTAPKKIAVPNGREKTRVSRADVHFFLAMLVEFQGYVNEEVGRHGRHAWR